MIYFMYRFLIAMKTKSSTSTIYIFQISLGFYMLLDLLQITFNSMTKEPVEDVFLTHLEMEFPEFRQISASIRGESGLYVHYFPQFPQIFFVCVCFLCVCTALHVCVRTLARLCQYKTKLNNMPISQTDKPRRSSAEVCGAVVSMNYKKVCCFFFRFVISLLDYRHRVISIAQCLINYWKTQTQKFPFRDCVVCVWVNA